MTDIAEQSAASKPSYRERRRLPRKKSLLVATLVTAEGSFECRILDFSRGGAKVECARPVDQGEAVTVTVESIGTYSGVVVWRGDDCFGIQFLAHSKTSTGACDAIAPAVSKSLEVPTATAGSIAGGNPGTAGERSAIAPIAGPKPGMSVEMLELTGPLHGGAPTVKARAGAVVEPVANVPAGRRKGESRTRRTTTPRLAADGEKVITLGAGEVLFREGDPGGRMYMVRSGTLCIQDDRADSKEEISAGGIVGEMGAVDSRLPRQATVVALTDCDLAEIDARRFRALLRQTPDFARTVMRAFLRRLPHRRMDKRAC